MRLVHEHNREIVMRWIRRERLNRIAVLEQYDRLNQLSDRRMLAQEYEAEGNWLMSDHPAEAERYFRLALDIYMDIHEANKASGTDEILSVCSQIAQALKLQGKEDTEVALLAMKYRGELYSCFSNAGLPIPLYPEARPLRNDYSGVCYVDLPADPENGTDVFLRTAYNFTKNKNGTGPWDDVQHLILSDRIQKLDDCSFTHCAQLEVFDSGNGVSYLGCNSFSNCPELRAVYLGASVCNRGSRVFSNCPMLESVYMDAAVKEQFIHEWKNAEKGYGFASWFKNCSRLERVCFSDETEYRLRD